MARPGVLELRRLPALVKLGLTGLLLSMGGGFVASFTHLVQHHENRDERPGFTIDDVRGAYHGIESEAPLRRAIEANHPAEIEGAAPLSEPQRRTLLEWLASDRISEDYDNLDLGDMAPAEIIATSCLDCHSRQAADASAAARAIPLDFWDDVKAVAFSREVNPTAPEIVIMSLHTHALSLATLSIVLALLLLASRWPRWCVGTVVALGGVALAADLAGQWWARSVEGLVWMIAVGGAVYGGASVLQLLMVLIDMWLPAGDSATEPA